MRRIRGFVAHVARSESCCVLPHLSSPQHTVIFLAYRERDPSESAWFSRAAEDFVISIEASDAEWKRHVTFETIDAPDCGSDNQKVTSVRSVVRRGVQTAAEKYALDARPLHVYRMQRRTM